MVNALFRKETKQTGTPDVKPSYSPGWRFRPAKAYKENFPYALQEFINSHMDLPSFEEIAGQQNRSSMRVGLAR